MSEMALLAPIKNDGSVARARDGDARSMPESGSHLLGSTLDSIDLRHMWTTVALTALAIFVIYRLTPQYTGSAQVLVGLQQVKLGTIQDVLSDLKGDNEMIATEIGIIRSRKLAEKTVTKLNLDNDPEFNPALQSPGLFANLLNSQHLIPQSWLAWFSGSSDPNRADNPDENRGTAKIIDIFEDKLKVTSDGRSRIITVSFQSENPITAAQIANTLADAYIVERLDAKFEATKRANIWLADRLNTLRQEVQVTEDAVEKFRNDNGLLRTQNAAMPGGQGMTLTTQQMAQVSTDAITAHTKYLEAQSRLAQLQRSGVTRG